MGVTLRVKNPEKIAEQFKLGLGARPTIKVDLSIIGPAAAYGMIWEWGRADISPGPKTTWGINPDGEVRVLTLTAPMGYIRSNRMRYVQIIKEELAKISWNKVKPKNISKYVLEALKAAGPKCAEVIASAAPIDSGDLRAALREAYVSEANVDVVGIRPRLSI